MERSFQRIFSRLTFQLRHENVHGAEIIVCGIFIILDREHLVCQRHVASGQRCQPDQKQLCKLHIPHIQAARCQRIEIEHAQFDVIGSCLLESIQTVLTLGFEAHRIIEF